MRISDWSSDVCSSDLNEGLGVRHGHIVLYAFAGTRLKRVKRPVTYAGEAAGSTPVKNLFWRYIWTFPEETGFIRMILDEIKSAQVAAMKDGEMDRLAAVRLILAKLKSRHIKLRTATHATDEDQDEDVVHRQ